MTEDALFQIQNLEEALNKNAQGILASTMKEEIKSLVKESLNEQEGVDDVDTEEDEDVVMIDDTEDVDDMGDMDTPPPIPPMDDVEMDDDETIDLRGASDDEVVKVFKLMGDEDGIVVTKDDDSISIVDGEDEYLIKLNEEINNEMEKTYNELDEMEDSVDWKEIEDELLNMGGNDDKDDEDDEEFEFELQLEDADDLEAEYSDEEINEILYELEMDNTENQIDRENDPTYAGEDEENLYEIELEDKI